MSTTNNQADWYAAHPLGITGGGGGDAGHGGTTSADEVMLDQVLTGYGLDQLVPWVHQQLVSGATADQITLLLRQQPAFQDRFRGIFERQAKRLSPISPQEYLAYEDQYQSLLRSAGLPQGFYGSRADISNLIGNDVSINEMADRIQQGYVAALAAPQATRDQLQQLYGIDQGHLAAFFLDPNIAEPMIMKQFHAANAAGIAHTSGFAGGLNASTAEQLAALGLSNDTLRSGFGELGRESQLFTPLPGSAESAINPEEQLAAQFEGNSQAQMDILKRQRERVAAFAGGEQFSQGQAGVSGLGTAQRT